jgi:hypothetical protein
MEFRALYGLLNICFGREVAPNDLNLRVALGSVIAAGHNILSVRSGEFTTHA